MPQLPGRGVVDAVARTISYDNREVEVYLARSPGGKARKPEAFMLEFTGSGTRAEDIAGWVASRTREEVAQFGEVLDWLVASVRQQTATTQVTP